MTDRANNALNVVGLVLFGAVLVTVVLWLWEFIKETWAF